MRLQVNSARTGVQWVRMGVRTFLRQPLAMSGLFFMFMAAVSVLSLVPLVGTAVSIALVPAATLGLMAATREAEQGRFPMPSQLIAAFRGGTQRTQAMLMLGGLYALALLVVVGLVGLLAGDMPAPAADAAGGAEVTPEMVGAALGRPGMWVAMLAYLPVLMAFWHAPPLVFWHGVKPAKSLFFSLVACWSNKAALFFFTIGWIAVFMITGLILGVLGTLLGGAEALQIVVYPIVLFMASMFHTSLWFTFRDSFHFDEAGASSDPAPTEGDAP
ncbi:BPSS1780 family membrane protein [Hydrogenophaga sp. XSHU_21]